MKRVSCQLIEEQEGTMEAGTNLLRLGCVSGGSQRNTKSQAKIPHFHAQIVSLKTLND